MIIIESAMAGALIIGTLICVVGLTVNGIRLTNNALKEAEKRKHGPWTWD